MHRFVESTDKSYYNDIICCYLYFCCKLFTCSFSQLQFSNFACSYIEQSLLKDSDNFWDFQAFFCQLTSIEKSMDWFGE